MSMAATANGSATVVDPGVKLLAERLASLSDRADWPEEQYGSLVADDVTAWLLEQQDEIYELVRGWADVATGEGDVNMDGNPELWLDCPIELTDWMADRRSNGRLLEAIKAVGQRWRSDIGIAPQAFLDDLDDDQTEDLNEWLDSVHDTLGNGGDLTANGGDLLVVPECLRTVVEPIPADEQAGGEASADSSASAAVDQQPPRAETPEEARRRLEDMLPIALRQLRDAESLAESRKKAHDAAKKNVDAMQDQLNALVEELSEALTGMAGGDFQTRLPFDRVEQQADSQQASEPAKSDAPKTGHFGVSVESPAASDLPPDTNEPYPSADPAAAWTVHTLTKDLLVQKCNGQCGNVGITETVADKLVDAGCGTIGLLEARMRTGGNWFKGISGVGKTKADDVCDALEALRRVFPVPAGE